MLRISDKFKSVLERLFALDLRSLAFLRIGLALYLLWDLWDRGRSLEAHYSDVGVYPVAFLQQEQYSQGYWWEQWNIHWPNYWSFHSFPGDTGAWVGFVFALNALFLIGMLVGYKTRFMVLVCWILNLSLQNRNMMVLHGGDLMVRMLLFWCQFLPLGARWSLDGSCAIRRAYGASVPKAVLSVGTFGLIWQVCLVYFFTALLKTGDDWLKDGTALYYALNIDLYGTWTGRILRQSPGLCWLLTRASLFWEAVGPLFLFVPLPRVRIATVLMFLAFHLLGIGLFMDVGPLSWCSVLLWIGLLPGEFWDGLSARWSKVRERPLPARLTAHYNTLVEWRNRRVRARVAARKPLPNIAPWLPTQFIAAFFVWFVTAWNIGTLPNKNPANYVPSQVRWLNAFIRLDQKWAMFAPFPSHDDGWFAMPAVWQNGKTMDLYTRLPVAWDKPDHVNRMFPDERWRKYLMNLWIKDYRYQWQNFGEWACRSSQLHDSKGNQLRSLVVWYMLEMTVPPGQKQTPPVKTFLWEHYCSPGDAPERIKRLNGITASNR
ncbi:MAG: HTTM domain-containing protein [Armatimonas sp.]